MTTQTEEFARTLAEVKVEEYGTSSEGEHVVFIGPDLDPRFDSLRGEHIFLKVGTHTICTMCRWDDETAEEDAPPFCDVRYDLDAWMDVAKECHLEVTIYYEHGYWEYSGGHVWKAQVSGVLFDRQGEPTRTIRCAAKGPTARDALANAIREWWESSHA